MIEIIHAVEGLFKIGAIRSDGVYEDRTGWFKNLIVDSGMDLLGTGTSLVATEYCGAGTGSTAPANGQTGLISPLGARSAAGTSAPATSGGSPVWYQSMTRVYTFGIGAVVGNVAELGTFTAATSGTMFSRALVKDGSGNPTTISILADEQLVVTYELRKYSPAADVTGAVSITVDGTPTNYSYTMRAANVSTNGYWASNDTFGAVKTASASAFALETQALGAVTGYPSGAVAAPTSASLASYSPGSFYRDVTYTWGISAANFGTGIGSVAFAQKSSGNNQTEVGYQVSFTPRLPKNNTKTLALTFRLTWSRYVA